MSPWTDITRTLRPGMIHWPTDRGFQLNRVEAWSGPGTFNLSEIRTSVHVGTHIDAPRHFTRDGAAIADLPLSRLCGPATVVDFPERRHVTAADLEAGQIPPGDRILLKTTNSRLWDLPAFDERYVGLMLDAARWLVDRSTPLVGTDYLSVEPYDSPGQPVHQLLLGAGVILVESLQLDAVTPGRYELIALPLKIEGADGSPARVIVRPWGCAG